ncbi:hypothetical protein HanIR_Chr13g0640781 [Helianthus annuus]|nr:hypothetical protein HanIR_Chr13g0640781 [Helianthus annuus]
MPQCRIKICGTRWNEILNYSLPPISFFIYLFFFFVFEILRVFINFIFIFSFSYF